MRKVTEIGQCIYLTSDEVEDILKDFLCRCREVPEFTKDNKAEWVRDSSCDISVYKFVKKSKSDENPDLKFSYPVHDSNGD